MMLTQWFPPHMQIMGKIGSMGSFPKYVKYNTFVTFLSVLSFFSRSSPQVKQRRCCTRLIAQTTCFRARRCLLGFRVAGDPPKGVNRWFQVYMRKSKNRNNSETTISINLKFEKQVKTYNCTSWVVYHFATRNPTWRTTAILKMAMTSWIVRFPPPHHHHRLLGSCS